MGWKPGKFLKKAWKGVKKVVKNIGRGIKRVAKGFMKAVGKLGVVGQLGLMFFMPYAVGALSNMFGNMIGAAGNWLGATAQSLTSGSSVIGKALGHTMNAIHAVGSGVGHVYSTITETISGAVNAFADSTGLGKGFDAVGNFFHEKVVNPTKQFFGFEASAYQPMFDVDVSGEVIENDTITAKGTKVEVADAAATDIPETIVTAKREKVEVADDVPEDVITVTADKKPKSLLDSATKKIKEEVEEGLYGGLRQEAREFITGEPPTPTVFGGSRYNFGNTLWTDPNQVSVWNNTFQQDQGNPWMAFSQQYYNQLQEGISNLLQDNVYEKEISAFNLFGKQQQRLQTKPHGGL